MAATNSEKVLHYPTWLETFDAEGRRQYTLAWRFPSGWRGQASIQRTGDRRQRVTFTWDVPPTSDEDLTKLIEIVVPEVLSRAEQTLDPLETTELPTVSGSAVYRTPISVEFWLQSLQAAPSVSATPRPRVLCDRPALESLPDTKSFHQAQRIREHD